MRASRWGAGLASVILVGAACTGGGGGTASSSPGSSASNVPVTTAVVTGAQLPFERTSAAEFPGTTLDQRLQMAKQVCDSIRDRGDDYVAWLTTLSTSPSTRLVPFDASQQTLTVFSGLAVRYVCPQYVAQLADALNGLSSSSGP